MKPAHVSNVFHVSQLRKYCFDSSHTIEYEMMQIRDYLTYETKLVQDIDRSVKQLKGKEIPLVKVVWKGLSYEEATWELEEEVKKTYPELYQTC